MVNGAPTTTSASTMPPCDPPAVRGCELLEALPLSFLGNIPQPDCLVARGAEPCLRAPLFSSTLMTRFCPLPIKVPAANGAPVDSDSDRVDLHSSSDSSYIGKSGIIEDTSSDEDHDDFVDFEGRSAGLESAPLVGARSAVLCPAAPSSVDCIQVPDAPPVCGDLLARPSGESGIEHRMEKRKFLMTKRQRRKISSILRARVIVESTSAQTPMSPIEETLQEDDVNALQFDDEQMKIDRARRAYESYHRLPPNSSSEAQVIRSSAGVDGWARLGGVLASHGESAKVVRSGPLQGMICRNDHEARLVERLGELNAGFRGDDPEQAASSIETLVDHIGKPISSTLCLCEGELPDSEVLVSSAE